MAGQVGPITPRHTPTSPRQQLQQHRSSLHLAWAMAPVPHLQPDSYTRAQQQLATPTPPISGTAATTAGIATQSSSTAAQQYPQRRPWGSQAAISHTNVSATLSGVPSLVPITSVSPGLRHQNNSHANQQKAQQGLPLAPLAIDMDIPMDNHQHNCPQTHQHHSSVPDHSHQHQHRHHDTHTQQPQLSLSPPPQHSTSSSSTPQPRPRTPHQPQKKRQQSTTELLDSMLQSRRQKGNGTALIGQGGGGKGVVLGVPI
ncbi:hypothetical protein BDZ91DRAFT_744040 [Kalaharituber pfeilii]|nr:hypothetical protein BDZ91DRAFT_744040 [Kalaharituber pfeilii]